MVRPVFISYATAQQVTADALSTRLRAAGISTWLATDNLRGGVDWVDAIPDAIEASALVLVLLSPEAVQSDWVDREIRWAHRQRRPLLPILIADAGPGDRIEFLYGHIQMSRLDDPADARALDAIVDDVRDLLADDRAAEAHVSDAQLSEAPAPRDPFAEKVTVARPAYFVVLVDCSNSMNHRLAGTTVSKKQAVADTVNGLLFQLFRTSRRTDGYRHFFDVSVLGYGLGPTGVDVRTLLDQDRIAVPDLDQTWKRVAEVAVQQAQVDDAQPVVLRQPVWMEPTANVQGHTIMAAAFQMAGELVGRWIDEHPSSIPPIVLNISDGDWTDGNPMEAVRRLQELSTALGSTVVFNCQLAGIADRSRGISQLIFPSELPEAASVRTREMFMLSSVVPESMREEARRRRYAVEDEARGFAFNIPFERLVDFLAIGSWDESMNEDADRGPRVWTRARDSGPEAHNEDAVRIDDCRAAGRPSVFVAIADGVSAAPFAGEWARSLVEAATSTWLDGELAAGIDAARRRFDPLTSAGAHVDFVLEDLWRERGSAATLLLAEIVNSPDGTSIRAAAVGDSVVLISDPGSVTSFPVTATDMFTSRPETVGTRHREVVVQRWAMDLAPGSRVALASDGIGAWMLGLAERAGPARLYEWLGDVDDGVLPEIDDDLTLVLVRVPDRPPVSRWRRLLRSLTRR